MPGWLSSVGSGPPTWMHSNATSTAWINRRQRNSQRKREQGKEDDDSRSVHTGSRQRGADTKGESWSKEGCQVDTHSCPRTPPLAGESLGSADRPCTSS